MTPKEVQEKLAETPFYYPYSSAEACVASLRRLVHNEQEGTREMQKALAARYDLGRETGWQLAQEAAAKRCEVVELSESSVTCAEAIRALRYAP